MSDHRTLPPNPGMLDVLGTYDDFGTPLLALHQALLRDGPSPFTKGERELIAAYTSGINACNYCYGVHSEVAQAFGVQEGLLPSLLDDLNQSDVDEKLIPVLKFARKLTREPAKMTDLDRAAITEAGWPESAIFHVTAICGLFNLMNRIAEGTGCVLSREAIAALGDPDFADRLYAART